MLTGKFRTRAAGLMAACACACALATPTMAFAATQEADAVSAGAAKAVAVQATGTAGAKGADAAAAGQDAQKAGTAGSASAATATAASGAAENAGDATLPATGANAGAAKETTSEKVAGSASADNLSGAEDSDGAASAGSADASVVQQGGNGDERANAQQAPAAAAGSAAAEKTASRASAEKAGQAAAATAAASAASTASAGAKASAAATAKRASTAKTTMVARVQDDDASDEAPEAKLTVRARVQKKGWTKEKTATAGTEVEVGTTGKGLRIDQLRFQLNLPDDAKGGIQVQVHMGGMGWQAVDKAAAGNLLSAGAAGKTIEAIRIMLVGDISRFYDICYRGHVQNVGWQKWARNGDVAGTTGRGLRMEALRVKLVQKKKPEDEESTGIVAVRGKGHVMRGGWTAWLSDDVAIGTTGASRALNAVKLDLDAGSLGGRVLVRAKLKGAAWSAYKEGEVGNARSARIIEALGMKLAGGVADRFDVMYRAHVQNVGWQPWTLNGGVAGLAGRGLRIEALQVKIVERGSDVPLAEGTYFISPAKNAARALKPASSAKGVRSVAATFADNLYERYYLRDEGNGMVSLQSVFSGLFLAKKNGAIVQLPDSSRATHRWQLSSWKGGYVLQNARDDKAVAFVGGKAALRAKGTRLVFTGTQLLPNGNYRLRNLQGNSWLNIGGMSYKLGDNAEVAALGDMRRQVFIFTNKGADNFEIKNAYSYQALDVMNGSSASGTNVRQWEFNNSAAQTWKAALSRKGGFTFTNKASGTVLTAGGSARAGNNVSANTAADARNQCWLLAPSGYAGNPAIPRAAAMIRDLSSKTNYAIAYDLTNHWLCVFQGSRGNWTMIKTWIISHGKASNPSPRGTFETRRRTPRSYGGSTIWYYTHFRGDNAFHSIKFKRDSMTAVNDGRLGKEISYGCVRMELPNAKFIYDLPLGTLVRGYK